MKTNVEKALERAVYAICLDDSSDYESALFGIIHLLGGDEAIDLLENDSRKAFYKYCVEEE